MGLEMETAFDSYYLKESNLKNCFSISLISPKLVNSVIEPLTLWAVVDSVFALKRALKLGPIRFRRDNYLLSKALVSY
jgi:hypothetical protein